MFSALSLNVSAAESDSSDGFNIDDMSVKAYNNETEESLQFSFVDGVYNDEPMRAYTIISTVDKVLLASKSLNLNSDHEYNLSFKYACTNLDSTVLMVMLSYYSSSGTLIKTDVIDTVFRPASGNNSFNVDFKPDLEGVSSGYNIKLEIGFLTTSTNTAYFRISQQINLDDKDDDSAWYQKIIDGIKEIPEKLRDFFTALGDRIGTFFSDLKDSFSSDVDDQTDSQGGFFSDLGDRISTFFDNLRNSITSKIESATDSIKNKFEEIGNSITSKFEEIGDKFTEFFDKFKPRVYEDLRWENAMVNNSSGVVSSTPATIVKRRACTSDLFYVPSGSVYNLDVVMPSDVINWVNIHQYTSTGEYIGGSFASEGITVLEQGYSYRFQIMFVDAVDGYSISELSDICNSYVMLYADEGWLTAFGHWILNGLSNLFIPSEYYFDEYSEEFKSWAAEHLGFLYTVFDLFSSLVEDLGELLSDDYAFIIPAAEFDLNGEHYVLWEEYEVPVSEYIESVPALKLAYNTYLVMLLGVLCFALINYARKTYDKITAN